MTPAQKEIYLVVDEWWKRFGFGPSIDDIMRITGEKSRGNVNRKMWALVRLGICKGLRYRARSIRPSYLKVRNIE
jgi:SOS-response transcriptional repressor LexA